MNIRIKRVYEKPAPEDGLRILVDRLWPRGLAKADANIDVWMKDVAPSNDLRRWYQHEVQKWPEFKERYFAELDKKADAVNALLEHIGNNDAVFLFASKALHCNNAAALKAYVKLVAKR